MPIPDLSVVRSGDDTSPIANAALGNSIRRPSTIESSDDDHALVDAGHAHSSETIRGSRVDMVEPSASEANIAGALSHDRSVVAHGISSMFHQSNLARSTQTTITTTSLDMEYRNEESRTRLFAHAALQRQREKAILRGPDVAQRMELDGEDPEMAFHLLDLHWNRQHFTYLISYRPGIMDSLMNNGPYANKLLLNAIYFSSSLLSDRLQLRRSPGGSGSAGERYLRRFKALLVDDLERPSIPTAVALLLCGATLVSSGRESTGWVYCGIAFR